MRPSFKRGWVTIAKKIIALETNLTSFEFLVALSFNWQLTLCCLSIVPLFNLAYSGLQLPSLQWSFLLRICKPRSCFHALPIRWRSKDFFHQYIPQTGIEPTSVELYLQHFFSQLVSQTAHYFCLQQMALLGVSYHLMRRCDSNPGHGRAVE